MNNLKQEITIYAPFVIVLLGFYGFYLYVRSSLPLVLDERTYNVEKICGATCDEIAAEKIDAGSDFNKNDCERACNDPTTMGTAL